jgi:hypothetical protein
MRIGGPAMSRYQSHAGVIDALGASALARTIGIDRKRVGGWKTRSSIPGGWFISVADAAAALGHPEVTIDLLAHLAAEKPIAPVETKVA